MSLADLLCDDINRANEGLIADYAVEDRFFIETIINSSVNIRKKILRYYEVLCCQEDNAYIEKNAEEERNVTVIQDVDGNNIVIRFALPVYGNDGEIERYNIFHASMLIRHSNDGKMYLYDIVDIKKETSNSLSK